ncbi:MAG: hypothetical protein ACRENL_11715, partial [Candidatus Dormibacteria bacterium]
LDVTFTDTGQKFPYVGALFSSSEGTFWYMGDRGDTLAVERIVRTVEQADGIDVLVHSHPSDFHSFLLHSTWDGGAEEGESHPAWVARTLETVIRIKPTLALPQTTSYRYLGAAAWMNRYLFPMRPEEFNRLVDRVAPGIATDLLTPGDAVQLSRRTPTVHRGALPFVRRVDNPDPRGLDPTVPPPPVRDPDPELLGDDELLRRVRVYLSGTLLPWLNSGGGQYREMVRMCSALGANYRLSCVLPSDRVAVFNIHARDGVFSLYEDDGAPPRHGELHTRIASSTLDRWIRDVIPYFVAAADCRRAGEMYDIAATATGAVTVKPVSSRCLVSAHLMSERERLERWLGSEVDRLLPSDCESPVEGG